MRFLAVKSVEQQTVLMLHKTRDLLVGRRTALITIRMLLERRDGEFAFIPTARTIDRSLCEMTIFDATFPKDGPPNDNAP
jgi:transposase